MTKFQRKVEIKIFTGCPFGPRKFFLLVVNLINWCAGLNRFFWCEKFEKMTRILSKFSEHLPRLLPRHYTLSSYLPSSSSNSLRFRFVYSVLDLPSSILEGRPEFQGIRRFGACTQWLLERRPGDEVQVRKWKKLINCLLFAKKIYNLILRTK